MKAILNYLCSILACIFVSGACADTSVWKVSKGKNYFYLGGTIHLLSASDHPLPEEFDKAYQDSSVIYFETDIGATQSPEFQMKLMTAMSYTDERTLSSELSSESYQKLKSFMDGRQLPIATFSKFQPWGVALMVSVMEFQRLGMAPHLGVDAHFNTLAKKDGKRTIGLETLEEQLSFLSSLANHDADEMVEYTLRDLKILPEMISMMKDSWRSGDLDAIADHASVKQMRREFPEVYTALLVTRNNNWMKKLTTLTDDKDTEFVLVGAMHLSGKEGLLKQLRSRGFEVEKF